MNEKSLAWSDLKYALGTSLECLMGVRVRSSVHVAKPPWDFAR